MNFPASVGAGQAQQGPSYGCLGSQPNPAWFFMQMASSGPVNINISSTFDVDFIAWGPFPNLTGVCSNLTSGNQVPVGGGNNGCSFSGSPTETLILANAVAGQFYVVLVTNYSGQTQTINMSQTNGGAAGAGVTNCGIICTVTAQSSGPICPGGTATISATTGTSITSYTWTGPGGYNSSNLTNVVTNVPSTSAYSLQGTTSNGTCLATAVVTVIPLPQYTVTPITTTVCQNGSFIVAANSNNPSLYTYQWSGPVGIQSPNGSSTLINTIPISTNTALVTYSIVVTPTALNCPFTTTMSVRINNPSTPTLTLPGQLCSTLSSTFATASPPGGTWYGNPIVASNGIISPNTATVFGTFPVSYSITIGTCSTNATGNISVSQYNTAALTGSIPGQCVQNVPFNLMSIVQNTNGIWSGVGVALNTFTAAGLPTGPYVLNYYNPSVPYPNVCPANSTVAVNVFNPPTPIITPITPKCTNSPSVQLLVSPTGGVWTGNSGVSPNGVYTPGASLNTVGTNTVVYTAGQGTCVASSSATFHVSQFNTAALSTSALNLCVTTNSVNLQTLATGTTTGIWTIAGNNPALTGSWFNPNGLQTAVYTVTYSTVSFPNPNLCPDKTALPISVLNPAVPSITQVGPFCSTDTPFQLSVSPSTGSFVPSLYLSAGGVFTPSMSAIGNNQVKYVIGTSTCNAVDTKFISVEAYVSPAIVATIPDQCNTGAVVNLLPLTANNLGLWSGPGVLGSSFNPAYSGTGIIKLFHNTASSPSGLCPAQATLAVNVFSLAPPRISLAGPFCNSNPPIKLQATPLGGIFGNNTPAVDVLGWFNPAFSQIGDNIINYSVTAGPCVAYAQTVIKIEKFISADFAKYAGPFCKNEDPIDLNSYVQNSGGTWSGPGMTGSLFTPSKANIGNGNIISYFTQSQTPDLCPDTSSMRIRVNDIPNVTVARDVEKGCLPVEVVFTSPNTVIGQGEWTLGDGSQPLTGLTVSHTYTAPGTYSVVFNYWDEIGCSSQTILNNAVEVFEVPKAGFTYAPYDEVTIANPDVQFINQSQNIGLNTYQWQIANMYSLPDVNPVVVFPGAGEYRITLVTTNQNGCKSEASDIIVVKPDFNVFIPNSFTPNYDGVNDAFLPVFSAYGLDPKTFDMEIFDRWGTSLYHTKDNTRGWDGSLQNKGSEPLKEEVYVYKLKYKDLEGKIYNKLGYVTLVR